MDPNGNGYVEQPEFEKYLEMYGIKIDKERCGYLFYGWWWLVGGGWHCNYSNKLQAPRDPGS